MQDLRFLPSGQDYDPPERVLCAANKFGELIIAGVRHGCDVMYGNYGRAVVLQGLNRQINDWDIESRQPKYREGHSCSYAVSELQDIINEHGTDLPAFKRNEEVQGFLTTKHRFLTRKEAWVLALQQNQIVRLVGSQSPESANDPEAELFSENLY